MTTPEHPGWTEIAIEVHPVAHEALSAFLFDLGCDGIASSDFGEEHRTLRAYLPAGSKDTEELANRISGFLRDLEGIFPEVRPFQLRFCDLRERDWGHAWRRFFHTDRITPNLTVVPAWEPVPDRISGQVIRMDPGPAFGTGQHATTRMCLEAMEAALPSAPWSMLDLGTGSGILAIYGTLLGARRIVAVDNDPEALRWAERNIELNGLSGSIELSPMPLEEMRGRFTLVAANLILGTILELFPSFPPVLEHGGRLILSGILKEQVPQVLETISLHGLSRYQVMSRGEWSCVTAGA